MSYSGLSVSVRSKELPDISNELLVAVSEPELTLDESIKFFKQLHFIMCVLLLLACSSSLIVNPIVFKLALGSNLRTDSSVCE